MYEWRIAVVKCKNGEKIEYYNGKWERRGHSSN